MLAKDWWSRPILEDINLDFDGLPFYEDPSFWYYLEPKESFFDGCVRVYSNSSNPLVINRRLHRK